MLTSGSAYKNTSSLHQCINVQWAANTHTNTTATKIRTATNNRKSKGNVHESRTVTLCSDIWENCAHISLPAKDAIKSMKVKYLEDDDCNTPQISPLQRDNNVSPASSDRPLHCMLFTGLYMSCAAVWPCRVLAAVFYNEFILPLNLNRTLIRRCRMGLSWHPWRVSSKTGTTFDNKRFIQRAASKPQLGHVKTSHYPRQPSNNTMDPFGETQ